MPKKKRKRASSDWQECSSPRTNEKLDSEITDLFNKTFTFEKCGNWKLPSQPWNNSSLWYDSTLQVMKQELNSTKDKLSDMDISQWHDHTQRMNPAGGIVPRVVEAIRPELCTQAWCKFHEILSKFDILPKNNKEFNSVHLCEAPGAFITSLNHFMKTHGFSFKWDWLANSLNPHYEGSSLSIMIPDDRLVLNTPDRWYFGPSSVGDILDLWVYEGLCSKVKEMGHVELVTADGSVNCQGNPAEQESIVSKLHYCEVTTALSILSDGGHFVLKMFTAFESQSICLLYLLNCLFEQVHIHKPATSKSGNSEVYVVCKHFIGREDFERLLPTMRQFFSDSSLSTESALFTKDQIPDSCSLLHENVLFTKDQIPLSYIEQHIACCQKFMDYQKQTILRNLECFNYMTPELSEHLNDLQEQCAEHYLNACFLKRLPYYNKVVPKPVYKPSGCLSVDVRLSGSFHDRKNLESLPWRQQVLLWKPTEYNDSFHWFEIVHCEPLDPLSWTPLMGKKMDRVHNSKFCSMHTLQQYNSVVECCEVLKQDPAVVTSSVATPTEDEIRCHILEDPVKCRLTDIRIVDVTTDNYPTDGELKTKECLLTLIVSDLKVLVQGSCLTLVVYDLLTRFTVGLIYIVSSCFRKVLIRPFSPDASKVVVVLQGFECCPNDILSYLVKVCDMFQTGDVQELVSIAELYSAKTLVVYINNANEKILHRRIEFLMEKERERTFLKTAVNQSCDNTKEEFKVP